MSYFVERQIFQALLSMASSTRCIQSLQAGNTIPRGVVTSYFILHMTDFTFVVALNITVAWYVTPYSLVDY